MVKKKYDPGTYRVFVTRHFIDVMWFDIKADSATQAEKTAKKIAEELRPSALSRKAAVDNHWQSDEATKVDHAGSFASGTHEMIEVGEGIFLGPEAVVSNSEKITTNPKYRRYKVLDKRQKAAARAHRAELGVGR